MGPEDGDRGRWEEVEQGEEGVEEELHLGTPSHADYQATIFLRPLHTSSE